MGKRGPQESFQLPLVVTAKLREITRRLIPAHRDGISGEIDTKRLTMAVMKIIEQEDAELTAIGRREAWRYAVNKQVWEHIRKSQGVYEIHHRQNRSVAYDRRMKMRREVTFRDQNGKMVVKRRVKVLMRELPLVWTYYERSAQADLDFATWCRDVYDEMKRRGYAEDTEIGKIVREIDDRGTGTI